jgi:hypothetical protein
MDMAQRYDNATIGASNMFVAGTYITSITDAMYYQPLTSGRKVPNFLFHAMAEPMWTTALITGLAQGSASVQPEAKFSCLTRNGTWAPYSSLAVCSSCIDITSQLEKNMVCDYPWLFFPVSV